MPATDYIATLRHHLKEIGVAEIKADLLTVPAEFKRAADDVENFSSSRVFVDCHMPLIFGGFAISAVLAETRGFVGWLILTSMFATALLFLSVLYIYKNMRGLRRFIRESQNRLCYWRMHRIQVRLDSLAEDSPDRDKLLNKKARSFFALRPIGEGPPNTAAPADRKAPLSSR